MSVLRDVPEEWVLSKQKENRIYYSQVPLYYFPANNPVAHALSQKRNLDEELKNY